jgi:RNA polymerase sigma factor (TIGR02999 family)
MSDVTQILAKLETGDPSAAEQLLPLVYDELRKLASVKMASEAPGQTLQATALVHEAYVRLVHGAECKSWDGRRHFFAAAAEAMRRILIEQARRKQGPRAGGGLQRLEVPEDLAVSADFGIDLLAISDAINEFQTVDARAAELVKLRFFAGATRQEAAEILGVSLATADNDWAYAKAWLQTKLADFKVDGA